MISFDELAELDGLISREDGEYLYEAARNVPEGQCIVEIGSYHGKSTCYLAAGAAEGTSKVYAVDPWSESESEWRRSVIDRLPSPSFGKFVEQVKQCGFVIGDDVIPMRSLSVKAAKAFKDGKVGLLYIDGNHLKYAVLADVRAWRAHLADDAVIIFDDYGVTKNPGVKEAVDELVAGNEIQLVEIAHERLAVAHSAAVGR